MTVERRFWLGLGMLTLLTACPQEGADNKGPNTKEPAAAPGPKAPASAPASAPAPKAPPGSGGSKLPVRNASDADYSKDPPEFPNRLGIVRRFPQVDKVNNLRDPVFIPGSDDILFMGRIGGVSGLYRMPVDGSKPAELIVARPLFTKGEKLTARNRRNWYIGTPRVFPDGKHVIFDGTQFSARQPFSNTAGLAELKPEALVYAVVVSGVEFMRTPSPTLDGKGFIFSSCTSIQSATLKGWKDQTVVPKKIFELPRIPANQKAVCTVHRPRYSPDGKHIVFEVTGAFVDEAAKKTYNIPEPLGQGDYVIEPWIMNADGTGARRLLKDATYERDLHTRLQTGGTKEPEVSPDGKWVVFGHGRSIAVSNLEGTKAHVIAASLVESNRAVNFLEGDPTFSADGRFVAAASRVLGNEENPRPAPAGVTFIDLNALDLGGAGGGSPGKAPAPATP